MTKGIWHENEMLARYNTWRVGGPAQYLFEPSDLIEQFHNWLCHKFPRIYPLLGWVWQ